MISDVESVMAWLHAHSSRATLDGMARYGLPSNNAIGVAMKDMNALARELGRDHELAVALWETGVYEARMMTSLIGDAALVTADQMERWCSEFDNWGICDTMCFKLLDHTECRWEKAAEWSSRPEEYVKRAGFALYWSMTVHDKRASDAQFLGALAAVEREAHDERHYVQKGIDMALRATGKRNPALRAAALDVARRLVASRIKSSVSIGKSAVRELGGK